MSHLYLEFFYWSQKFQKLSVFKNEIMLNVVKHSLLLCLPFTATNTAIRITTRSILNYGEECFLICKRNKVYHFSIKRKAHDM